VAGLLSRHLPSGLGVVGQEPHHANTSVPSRDGKFEIRNPKEWTANSNPRKGPSDFDIRIPFSRARGWCRAIAPRPVSVWPGFKPAAVSLATGFQPVVMMGQGIREPASAGLLDRKPASPAEAG
jgi:hypothetical protein